MDLTSGWSIFPSNPSPPSFSWKQRHSLPRSPLSIFSILCDVRRKLHGHDSTDLVVGEATSGARFDSASGDDVLGSGSVSPYETPPASPPMDTSLSPPKSQHHRVFKPLAHLSCSMSLPTPPMDIKDMFSSYEYESPEDSEFVPDRDVQLQKQNR